MSAKVVLANGVVLAGIGLLCVLGARPGAGAVMARAGEMTVLEEQAGLSPSPASLARLATAYLDREQPGLASAVLERAGSDLQKRPEIAQIQARALFGQGRARDALEVARRANDACGDDAGCAPWLVAKTTRQLAFLEEVVAAGIDDPYADPAATMAAYERSSHEVRLVAMR